jgi:hypothetical protein
MKRSLAVTVGAALAAGAVLVRPALAQAPWPAPPQTSQTPAAQAPASQAPAAQAAFPPPPQTSQIPAQQFPPAPQQSVFPSAPQQSTFPGGPGGGFGGGPPPQMAAQCANFPKLRDAAKAKAEQISAVGKRHGDRKEMCAAVQTFTVAEGAVVKFLEDYKTSCGVPDQAIAQAKAMHAKTMQFRDTVCAEGPKPKIPTLSDAIGSTPVDTDKNTKTGRGTFDTLTGNPLQQR